MQEIPGMMIAAEIEPVALMIIFHLERPVKAIIEDSGA
jgi:hypothetical protein